MQGQNASSKVVYVTIGNDKKARVAEWNRRWALQNSKC